MVMKIDEILSLLWSTRLQGEKGLLRRPSTSSGKTVRQYLANTFVFNTKQKPYSVSTLVGFEKRKEKVFYHPKQHVSNSFFKATECTLLS